MKPRICPCCGQVIAPELIAYKFGRETNGDFTYNDDPFTFGPIKKRIYDAVRRHPGISRKELMDAVYTDADGGALSFNVISVHVSRMNQKLALLGIRVRGRGWHGYRIEAI